MQDVVTAVNLTQKLRKARKAGAVVEVRMVREVPLVDHAPTWLNTIESGLTWKLGRDTDRAVMEVLMVYPTRSSDGLSFLLMDRCSGRLAPGFGSRS